jgi:hypothetical protein
MAARGVVEIVEELITPRVERPDIDRDRVAWLDDLLAVQAVALELAVISWSFLTNSLTLTPAGTGTSPGIN